MATSRRWSRTVGARRGARVRIYERAPGGVLYCSVWLPGRGECRRSLGHRDRKLAIRQAEELLRLEGWADPEAGEPALTLGDLFRLHAAHGRHLPDGSLKTAKHLEHCASTGKNLVRHFGADFEVRRLTADRITGYARVRRVGEVSGREVRTATIERELVILKAVLNWACGFERNGSPLLERNPLDRYKIPRERDPRRPVVDTETVEAVMGVARNVHPFLPLLITLASTTGRRLSSILGLRWDDVDFEKGRIRWRAELDKTRRTSSIPLPARALGPLLRFRAEHPGIGGTLLFPHPRPAKKGQPVTPDLAAYWLRRAFKIAGVPKPEGSLWHAFRRRWATERKHLPVKDVAAAGGWKDINTLLTCYQQVDEETLQEVIDYEKPQRMKRHLRRAK